MKRLLAALALVAFVAALVAIVLDSSSGGGDEPTTTTRPTRTRPVRPTPPPRPKVRAIKLSAVGAFDPEGDQHENDSLVPLAVDGDTSTFWKTEHYTNGFFKTGVGIVLDTGGRHRLTQVAIGTDAPGASAQIQLGNNPNGPFHPASADLALTGTTVFKLRKRAVGRYLVVWITSLPLATGEAHVTEVRAAGI